MGGGRIKAEPGDPNNSIATRIRTAMSACGMKSVAELGRRIGPRQTVHRWINGDTKNMTHENRYKAADALQVRARWLAVGDTAPAQIDLGEGDVVGLIKIYETMSSAAREQWLAIGRTHAGHAYRGQGHRGRSLSGRRVPAAAAAIQRGVVEPPLSRFPAFSRHSCHPWWRDVPTPSPADLVISVF